MHVVLASADLLLMSSAQTAADRYNSTLIVAATPAQAREAINSRQPRLLVVDLRLPGLDIQRMVATLGEAPATRPLVLACGPHVHEASLAEAARAGCDEVVTRGQFDRRLDAVLRHLTGDDDSREASANANADV